MERFLIFLSTYHLTFLICGSPLNWKYDTPLESSPAIQKLVVLESEAPLNLEETEFEDETSFKPYSETLLTFAANTFFCNSNSPKKRLNDRSQSQPRAPPVATA